MESLQPKAQRGRPSTRNRGAVLEKALHAYWQDDRAATSVNAICALAGVSKPSLYRDFGSEDGLTAAVLQRYSETVLAPLGGLLSSPARFKDKIQALIQFASDDPQMAHGCLFVKMRGTRSRFGEQTQALIAATEANFLAQYTALFQTAANSGEWKAEISAEMAAGYLNEQLGLAVSQRAAGQSKDRVQAWLRLALSVFL